MSGFINAEEVEVTNRLELAVGHSVDSVISELCGLESGTVRVVD